MADSKSMLFGNASMFLGDLRHDFGALAFLTCCGAGAYVLGCMAHPQRFAPIQNQKTASKEDVASFGAAADANTVFTPEEASKLSKQTSQTQKEKQEASRYRTVRWMTYAIDYGYLFGSFSFYNSMFSGENWSPLASAAIIPINGTALTCVDLLKAWLFSDVLAEAKLAHLKSLGKEFVSLFSVSGMKKVGSFFGRVACGEGLIRDFRDKNEARRGVLFHMFYFAKIILISVPLSSYAQTAMGMFTFTPLSSVVAVFGAQKWWEVRLTVLATVYMEYLLMSFIKDATSMNILHQMMHKQWYPMHKVHHMPMKELSGVNVWYFDLADVVIENIAAPMILLIIKLLSNPTGALPSLHYLSFILLAVTDINIHSICPYTVGFFNPLLDSCLKCNISHQLHHALNIGHYTVWPWHQLRGVSSYDTQAKKEIDGSIALEMENYNTVFHTHFPA